MLGKILGKKFCVTDIQENPLFLSALDHLGEKKASAMIKMSRTLSRYIPQKGSPVGKQYQSTKIGVIQGDQTDKFTFVNHVLH